MVEVTNIVAGSPEPVGLVTDHLCLIVESFHGTIVYGHLEPCEMFSSWRLTIQAKPAWVEGVNELPTRTCFIELIQKTFDGVVSGSRHTFLYSLNAVPNALLTGHLYRVPRSETAYKWSG